MTLDIKLIQSIKLLSFNQEKLQEDLTLNNCQIDKIQNAVFKEFSNLTNLDLSNNKIKSIDDSTFDSLKLLKKLNLSFNKLIFINERTFGNLSLLTHLDLSNNKIQSIGQHLFTGLELLEDLDLSYNELQRVDRVNFLTLNRLIRLDLSKNKIQSIDKQSFIQLCSLKNLYLDNNQIQSFNKKIFNKLDKLTHLHLNNNKIESIKQTTFNKLNLLQHLHLGNNKIVSIENTTFNQLISLTYLNLSNNLIQNIDHKTFDEITKLERLNLSNNRISSIDKNLFKELKFLKHLYLNNNQLKSIENTLFIELKNLRKLDLNNNQIKSIDISTFYNLENLNWINLSNNLNLNFEFIFSSFFSIISCAEKPIETFKHKSSLNNHYRPILEYLFQNNPNKDETKNSSLIIRNSALNSSFFFLLFFFKSVFKYSDIFTNTDSFLNLFDQYNNYSISLFDFILKFKFDSSFYTYFINYFKDRLKQDKSMKNLEFTMKCADSFKKVFEKNDISLFEAIFGVDTLNTEFVLDKTNFFLNINYSETFKIIFKNKNEKLATYFFKTIRQVFEILKITKNDIKKYDCLFDFNQMFLKDYFKSIYNDYRETNKQRWHYVIETILDAAYDKEKNNLNEYFICIDNFEFEKICEVQLNEPKQSRWSKIRQNLRIFPHKNKINEQQLEIKIIDKKDSIERSQNFNEFSSTKNDNLTSSVHKNQKTKNILYWLHESQNERFLLHPTTLKLVDINYKYVPRLFYFLNLFFYFTLIIFYSNYCLTNNENLRFVSKCISQILILIFLSVKIIEFIYSIRSKTTFIYLSDFKNIIEIIGFPFCVASLLFQNNTYLYTTFNSATILVVYFIFISRLDKTFIGPYVNVFGKIIRNSVSLFFIVIAFIIAFAISFQIRVTYYRYLDNEFQKMNQTNDINFSAFDNSFEKNLFVLLKYLVGNIDSDGVGIEQIYENSLINFIIYLMFIFLMPILLINVFTGISIDEIQKLLKNAECEIVSSKIDYILIEGIHKLYQKLDWLKIFLQLAEEKCFKLKNNLKKVNFLKLFFEKYSEFKKNRLNNDSVIDMEKKISKLEDKLVSILRLNQDIFNKEEILESELKKITYKVRSNSNEEINLKSMANRIDELEKKIDDNHTKYLDEFQKLKQTLNLSYLK